MRKDYRLCKGMRNSRLHFFPFDMDLNAAFVYKYAVFFPGND